MKYKTAFRLALKLVGVWILAFNAPGFLVWAGRYAWYYYASTLRPGSAVSPYDLVYTLQTGIGVAIGLYLLFGGEWIVRLAIPSNRPYCPECGYDLCGLSESDRCPECGTILPEAVRDAIRRAAFGTEP